MERYDFIKLMLQNRNLSVNDKKRLLLLATREIERVDTSLEQKKEDPRRVGGDDSDDHNDADITLQVSLILLENYLDKNG